MTKDKRQFLSSLVEDHRPEALELVTDYSHPAVKAMLAVCLQPLSHKDEEAEDRLLEQAHKDGLRLHIKSGRSQYRIRQAAPYLATGRVCDACNRIWLIPSTRKAGVVYTVDLKTRRCSGKCFNCPHVKEAQIAETRFIKEMANSIYVVSVGGLRWATDEEIEINERERDGRQLVA